MKSTSNYPWDNTKIQASICANTVDRIMAKRRRENFLYDVEMSFLVAGVTTIVLVVMYMFATAI